MSDCNLKSVKSIKSMNFTLEYLKNIISFTRFLKTDMYKSPLYGKEWNWRNIKMETREMHIDLRPDRPEEGIFCVYAASPFFVIQLRKNVIK
jgi:hypothetical protein